MVTTAKSTATRLARRWRAKRIIGGRLPPHLNPKSEIRNQKSDFPWRFALYTVITLYLIGDLYWFGGPLSEKIAAAKGGARTAAERGWVARVYGVPITLDDVARGLAAYAFRRGLEPEALGPPGSQRRLAAQVTVLEDLVLEEIVAGYARNDRASVESVTPEEIDAALARIRSTFESDEAFATRLAAAGLDGPALRARLAADLASRNWIDERLDPAIAVTDAEVRAFYEAREEELVIPETVRARHLFLPASGEADREPEIRALADALAQGADFAELAASESEDRRSAPAGGDLGYFRRDRMPADFVDAVWNLPLGEASQPFQTRLGWHIAEVLDRRPQQPAPFEAVAPEIRATLENQKREKAIAALKAELKRRAANHLEYYYDTLLQAGPDEAPPTAAR